METFDKPLYKAQFNEPVKPYMSSTQALYFHYLYRDHPPADNAAVLHEIKELLADIKSALQSQRGQ
ncbi:hypothetical protein [Runella slithyformis]|uniref:Uncharacterized protein n=1 Tax=Runella slithyformis (strain ATCC 29530 / DSM 19594 / LMG 11500 / NCIMB 11436 / LSU 4) TaxID=761193 RepID=A0A7U3ZHU4_RUNSL|nr:hypothetical protein [Runella slithyformis]AEI47440.1 hypothetical protein Runsl_1009 [Runella slithyformis DSM 19594]